MKLMYLICAGSMVLSGFACAEGRPYSVEEDIPFGDLPQQVMDVYAPDTVEADTPVLVFIFGGGFSRGDKAQIRRIGATFSQAGIIVVAPNYRLYPDATFPDFVEDAALAVSYVWHRLRDEEGLPRPIFVGGWSAGAYISALVAYDGRYLEAADTPPGAIQGFIGLAGPYEGGLCAGHTCPHIFPDGTDPDWPVARFVDADDPPMLLVRGSRDRFVDKSNLVELAASGNSAGIAVTTLVAQDAFHEDVLSEMKQSGTSVRQAVDVFMKTVLARQE